jgi:hypothetical protein
MDSPVQANPEENRSALRQRDDKSRASLVILLVWHGHASVRLVSS